MLTVNRMSHVERVVDKVIDNINTDNKITRANIREFMKGITNCTKSITLSEYVLIQSTKSSMMNKLNGQNSKMLEVKSRNLEKIALIAYDNLSSSAKTQLLKSLKKDSVAPKKDIESLKGNIEANVSHAIEILKHKQQSVLRCTSKLESSIIKTINGLPEVKIQNKALEYIKAESFDNFTKGYASTTQFAGLIDYQARVETKEGYFREQTVTPQAQDDWCSLKDTGKAFKKAQIDCIDIESFIKNEESLKSVSYSDKGEPYCNKSQKALIALASKLVKTY